ncbi:MAG: class I adenylate-forming enzyme family protein [Gemmatimonadota bacterium]|nr:class I adenylate-forming enzyme family protein [Gemmatimonadota bacterium]
MTPADDLARRAATTPDATALAWDGGHFTFAELDEAVTSWSDRIRHAGVPPRSFVTLCLTPGPQAAAALFGAWRSGSIAMPLHEGLTDAEVAHAHQTVNSGLHIDNSGFHFAGREATEPAHPPDRGGEHPGDAGRPRHPGQRPEVPPHVVAFLLTSGSSGAPKAIGFGHDAFAASAAAVTRRLALTPDDRWGLCLSLGHIGGLSLVVRAVMNGSSVRLWPSFDEDAIARAVVTGDVTHLAVVPVMLRRLLARLTQVPETLRCVLVGGAASSPALLDDAWRAGLPVAPTWGMTETASQVATVPPDLARRFPGTVGRPLAGVEVRSGPGNVLAVRGPTLASVTIAGPGRPAEPLCTDADGWFTTSDIGRVDDNGLVWIEGRKDAIIVSGGLNVSPREVEHVIETLPGVARAVVFGVPSEEWGEVVVAVVERDRPAGVSAPDIERHCRARLARGRRPRRIVVVDELPRTRTGKVMRVQVAERYGHTPGD